MNEMIADSHLKIATDKLNRLKTKLVLSNTLNEKFIHLYKKILEKNIGRGRSIDAMIAATIYVACRDSKTPITLNDITKVSGLRKNSIAKCYRAILVTLNLQIPPSNINQYVFRIVKNMKISDKVKLQAIEILNNAKKRNHLAGKEPMGIAAASIYLASIINKEKISQRKLAESAMITEVTIRNRCKGLCSLN